MQRDERGSPSGPMFDNVRTIFIMPNLPKATEDDLVEGYRWLSAELNRHGVTSAYEASFRQREHLSAWRRLREEGALTLRVNMGPYPLYGDEWERDIAAAQVFESGAYSGFGDEWIKLGSLTYGMDGDPMGPHSALFEPYSNDPRGEYRGSFRVSPEKADSFSLAAHSRGWQISAVCFGDHGITVAVDAIEKAQKTFSRANPRHRLEHAHTWNESLLRRCGELGIVWNLQPALMAALGRGHTLDAWGPRSRFGFPVKSALEHGIVVSGGSDWSVDDLNPMIGIHALVTRRLEPLEEGDMLAPEEAVSVLDAIRIYTFNGAYTVFEEDSKGYLEVGKLADVTVLSEDILSVPADRIRELRTVLTILDGKVVYDSDAES